ncbi:MAG: hypothetical protein NW216_07705 [Hyphomicrobium sp.]|nr:hypothetical protein [Hyphomicrobium sp.]
MTTDTPEPPRPPDGPTPAPGTLAKDVMSNSRIGPLVKAVIALEKALAGLGMINPNRRWIVTVDERDGMWLEALAVKYTGRGAHQDHDGRPLTPIADGTIRRFRMGFVEFQYRSTI